MFRRSETVFVFIELFDRYLVIICYYFLFLVPFWTYALPKKQKRGKMQKVTLTVNGARQEVMASPDLVLIDVLREDLHLTGTKQSCDRKGQCGACTVIVNGKATRSCVTKVSKLDGADIITVEGLGTPENPHFIQEAFVLAGAIQCGFCTPGMIMAAKGLLDENTNPDVAAIKKALARNLCRCTGYKKIVEAIQLAGQFIRKETTPDAVRAKLGTSMLNVSHPRPTAMVKACGVAQFGADIQLPANRLEISVVRSTEYHAVIKSVDTSKAEKMPGVAGVVRASDIKGTNRLRQVHPDQPVLCEDKVKILGDPIVIVAADTKAQADAAAAKVKVTYEPLPVVFEPEDALKPGAYVIHAHAPDNICAKQPIIKGDAQKALSEAKAVVEAYFTTQTNHQAPLEPETCVAYFEGEGEKEELVVCGRSINIHFHLNQLKEALGYPKMRYKEPFSGGQFGIKTWITSEAVAAAAAIHFKRPIRYIPTLEESILICNKRHSYHIKTKLCADAENHISALFCDWLMNKGAYTLNGPVLLGRSIMMLSGSYNIPNLEVMGKSVYTNNAYTGSARGAGPPQTTFATEVAVDMLAEKLGIDELGIPPHEFPQARPDQVNRHGRQRMVVSSKSATPSSLPMTRPKKRRRNSTQKTKVRLNAASASPPIHSASAEQAIPPRCRSKSIRMTASRFMRQSPIRAKETTACWPRLQPIN